MNIDLEEIAQEKIVYRLEFPDSRRCDKFIIIDILCKLYPERYNRKHVRYDILHIDDCLLDTESCLWYYSDSDDMLDAVRLLDYLNERDRDIVRKYYLDGMSQVEIASIYGYTQARVNQLIMKSLRKIRICLKIN